MSKFRSSLCMFVSTSCVWCRMLLCVCCVYSATESNDFWARVLVILLAGDERCTLYYLLYSQVCNEEPRLLDLQWTLAIQYSLSQCDSSALLCLKAFCVLWGGRTPTASALSVSLSSVPCRWFCRNWRNHFQPLSLLTTNKKVYMSYAIHPSLMTYDDAKRSFKVNVANIS